MKLPGLLVIALALAGCAAPTSNLAPYAELRQPQNLRDERLVFTGFPGVQSALMRHQAVCGVNYQFRLQPRETSFATIVYEPEQTGSSDPVLYVELVWLQASVRQEARIRFTSYSNYGSAAANDRVAALFAAIDNPSVCPGQEAPQSS